MQKQPAHERGGAGDREREERRKGAKGKEREGGGWPRWGNKQTEREREVGVEGQNRERGGGRRDKRDGERKGKRGRKRDGVGRAESEER